MAKFDLSQYEEVKDRLPKFYKKYPDGRVTTDIVFNADKMVIVKAKIYKNFEEQVEDCPLASGLAYEKENDGYVNKTSYIENCETSAIGRALANITLHGDKRPSREEMQKVEKMTSKKIDNKEEEGLF